MNGNDEKSSHIILILMLFATPSFGKVDWNKVGSAVGRVVAPTMTVVGSVAQKLNPKQAAKRFFSPDPLQLSAEGYYAIANKSVPSYFEGKDFSEGMDASQADFSRLEANISRVHLRRGQFRNQAEVFQEIIGAFKTAQQVPDRFKGLTLEQLFLQVHQEKSAPELASPRSGCKQVALAFLRVGMAVGGAGAGIVASQVSWNFKNIMYETTDFVNTPIRTNISRLTNEKLGGIGVMMQMSITQMQQAVEAHRKMVATAEEMDEQAQKLASGKKFAVDGMNLDEVKRAWLEGEEAFLEYRKELNSVLPDNVALGRSYFANANILTPLSFSTAISAAKTEVTLVEDRISNLEFRMKKEGQLSESDQQLLKAAYADLELNKRKMGTTLALVRVYQLFYPEHARPSWSDNPKKGNPFMNQYGEILDGLGFEYYAQEYNRELKEQLSALGLQISGADINAVARRQKVLVDKIGELSRN